MRWQRARGTSRGLAAGRWWLPILASLRGPAHGAVGLLLRLFWGSPDRSFDLDKPAGPDRVVAAVALRFIRRSTATPRRGLAHFDRRREPVVMQIGPVRQPAQHGHHQPAGQHDKHRRRSRRHHNPRSSSAPGRSDQLCLAVLRVQEICALTGDGLNLAGIRRVLQLHEETR